MSIRVLSLNCWCVGYAPVWLGGSRDRGLRVQAIARYLAGKEKGEDSNAFDVVCLQEMWVSQDRDAIKSACRHVFPHSREYFG